MLEQGSWALGPALAAFQNPAGQCDVAFRHRFEEGKKIPSAYTCQNRNCLLAELPKSQKNCSQSSFIPSLQLQGESQDLQVLCFWAYQDDLQGDGLRGEDRDPPPTSPPAFWERAKQSNSFA